MTWTATFTADDDFDGTGSVTVSGEYKDAVGNIGVTGATDDVDIDTENPDATVDIADADLNDSDNSSLVTITFTEAVVDFDDTDLTVVGGAVSGLSSSDGGVTWTATFTADDDFDGTGSVTVSGEYKDAVGNIGVTGATDDVDIDTENPTRRSTSPTPTSTTAQQLAGDDHVQRGGGRVRATATSARRRGTMSDLVMVDATGMTWTAMFTADDDFDGTGSVSVSVATTTRSSDAAGNDGGWRQR